MSLKVQTTLSFGRKIPVQTAAPLVAQAQSVHTAVVEAHPVLTAPASASEDASGPTAAVAVSIDPRVVGASSVPAPPPPTAAKVDSDDDDMIVGTLIASKKRPRDTIAPVGAATRGSPVSAKVVPKKSATAGDDSSLEELDDEEDHEVSKAATRGKAAVAAPKAASSKHEAAAGTASLVALASEYHPVRAASEWCPSGVPGSARVPYAALVAVFGAIEATTKRLAITSILCNFFRTVIVLSPDDLLPVLYLCTNSLTPAYVGLELGVGDSILTKALAESTGRAVKDIKSEQEAKGDLGLVAETSRAKQRTLFGSMAKAPAGSLSVAGVYAAFKGIALEGGKASVDKKAAAIKKLLVACTGTEAKYIIRGMQGKLRIGLAQATVLVALAQAVAITVPLHDHAAFAAAAASAVSEAGGVTAVASSSSADASAAGAALAASHVLSKLASAAAAQDAAAARVATEGGGDAAAVLGKRRPQLEIVSRPGRSRVILDAGICLSSSEQALFMEESARVLKQVFSELPSYDLLVPALLEGGIPLARSSLSLTAGIPVHPMLAKPTRGVREVLQRFEGESFTCEWKYDGERAQVHLTNDGTISIFSRNSENTTVKYPDLALTLGAARSPGVTSCILDGEVVAYDPEKATLLPFQVLSKRARKDVSLENITVPAIYAAFDLLYLNGESLVKLPLVERRRRLHDAFHVVPGRFQFATSFESSDVEEIATFLNDSVKGGCEGLMVKVLDGPDAVYEPAKRSHHWLKLKKDYMDGLTDSFDLVPIAAWFGKGKRTGVYGAYLLACYDPDEEVYQAICKVGTGFSEEVLTQLTEAFNSKGCARPSKPNNVVVGDSLSDASVWFEPEESEVWEIMAADLSISPVHMAALGKVSEDKGIALRFPRFLRRRDDKGPVDCTTAEQVAHMYRSQGTTMLGMVGGDDED